MENLFTIHDFMGIAPVVLSLLGAVAIICLDIFLRHGDDREIMPVTTAGTLVGVAVTLLALWKQEQSLELFQGQLVVDRFGVLASLACTFAAGVTVLMSPNYLQRRNMEYGEYYGLILLALCGMILMCMARSLMTVFLALETMSLAIFGLVGLARTDPLGAEAAVKYFVLGAFGSGFVIFGIALVGGGTGTLMIPQIGEGLAGAPGGLYLLMPAFGLLLIGFSFKIGAAPFHAWVPDVYQGAPTMITGYMAAAVKVAAAAVFGRLLMECLAVERLWEVWEPTLAVLAGLSLFIGGFVALVQRNVKRMLGYSAISHTGFLLLAFLGPRETYSAGAGQLMVYLVGYAVAVAGPFGVLAILARGKDDVTDLDHLAGLASKRPYLAAAMALFMLSLAGLPGTVGFVAKLVVLKEALMGGHLTLVLFGIVMSLASLGYYLPVLVSMYMKDPVQDFEDDERMWGAEVAVALCALGTLLLGIVPQVLLRAGEAAANNLAG